jgi:hypothetical protein
VAELSEPQDTRLRVLDLVRRMVVGEDVPVEDVLVMAGWVLNGDHGPALQLRAQIAETYPTPFPTDAEPYRSGGRA